MKWEDADGLIYPSWRTPRLLKRLMDYAAYVGCGCPKEVHEPFNSTCARADFERIARELQHRHRRKGLD